MKSLILILSILFKAEVLCVDPRVDPLVYIPQGLVRGIKSADGDYSTFFGVPYAQVNLEDPFGPAQPYRNFGDVIFNAFDGSIKCPQTRHPRGTEQVTQSGTETLDCLRLNIYVPNAASSRNPLPVLVWIHGGGFLSGAAGEFGGQKLVKHGVVIVAINYRLGPYGFMCLDSPLSPGNRGLKDQYMALRWIRDNIAAFGGNPYNVTIAGQSAGSASVLLQLFSDKEKLFHKVIAQSGSPQNMGMFVEANLDAAVNIAQHLGVNATTNEEALSFLSQTSHELVTAAAADLNLILIPCREKSFNDVDNFIETDPFLFSNERKIRNTPILIGHTDREEGASTESDPFYSNIQSAYNLEENELTEVAKLVRHFYIGDEPVSNEVHSKLADFESDFIFNHPIQRTITSLLNNNANPVYEYVFSYVGESENEAASHGEEMFYLFDVDPDVSPNVHIAGEEDAMISDRITTLWANFVKYGNPTPQSTELLPVIWQPVTEDTRPYLVIDTDIRLESRVYKDRMAFWDLFFSIYGKQNRLARNVI